MTAYEAWAKNKKIVEWCGRLGKLRLVKADGRLLFLSLGGWLHNRNGFCQLIPMSAPVYVRNIR